MLRAGKRWKKIRKILKKGVDKGEWEWYYSQAVREDDAASGRQQSEEQKDLEKVEKSS